jgi:hypothetical protein
LAELQVEGGKNQRTLFLRRDRAARGYYEDSFASGDASAREFSDSASFTSFRSHTG